MARELLTVRKGFRLTEKEAKKLGRSAMNYRDEATLIREALKRMEII